LAALPGAVWAQAALGRLLIWRRHNAAAAATCLQSAVRAGACDTATWIALGEAYAQQGLFCASRACSPRPTLTQCVPPW
jgi:cytochrome c-type biogenesis protein CcmH/NrfG